MIIYKSGYLLKFYKFGLFTRPKNTISPDDVSGSANFFIFGFS